MNSINITKNSSRPLAAQFSFKGHLLSTVSVLSEFIEHLPAATEFGVRIDLLYSNTVFKMKYKTFSLLLLSLLPLIGLASENSSKFAQYDKYP